MKLLAVVLLLHLNHATTLAYTIKSCKYDAYDSADPADNFKCYNGGLCYRLEHNNSTNVLKICTCKPGFTGKHCEQSTLTPCSPDPCAPNGYCNAQTDAIGHYCQCKPGFAGPTCADNVNDCLNATCFNGGLCIDGINSYECDCEWPFIGRYCQTQMKCSSEGVCKNGAACVQEEASGPPKCVCPEGFEGADCSLRVDKCASRPCVRGECAPLLHDYQCQCPLGYAGKNCQHEDVCALRRPCRHNSTCVTLTLGHDQKYMCQCGHGFTGVNCETSILAPRNETDGAFVLVVNISPDEFKQRRHQIISQFEKRFGIMISVKKSHDQQDMIYAFNRSEDAASTSRATWTKVYFIFISACIQNEPDRPVDEPQSVCLQNSDVSEVLDQLKKSSALFPKYVTDVSYEAYQSGEKKKPHDQSGPINADSSLTLTLCFVSIALLVGISLALTVIIKQQQQRRVKAPVWFPPAGDSAEQKFDSDKSTTKMSFGHNFLSRQKLCTMPPDNDYADLHLAKMKPATTHTVDYYPSPPESLPESLQPANYKTSSSGLTPLMLFVLGRSRNASAGANESADCVDSLVNSGADLHSQNSDGETALHLAARAGLYRVCERLVQHRADLAVFDKYGRNVLHTAVCANQYNIVKLMLDHCNSMLCASNTLNHANLLLDDKYDLIDSKTNDDLGDTCLIIACRLSLNAIVQLLIDYNATVNATDNEGRSALHWCAKVNNVSGACALLKAGANVNMQDNDEKTPLSSGLSEMCTLQVADLLIRHEAFVSGDDEIKYNKMKSVMEAMSGVHSVPRHIKTVKSGAQPSQPLAPPPPPAHENKLLKSVATKRKLNEAAAAADGRSVKSKRPAKKSSTPSPPPPPPPYTVQPVYSYANHYDVNYSAYYYGDSNYAYASTQPFYLKPVSMETKLDAASLGGNVNMGFMSDSGFGAKSAQFQVKQETAAAHGQQSTQLYSNQYAAYF